MTPTPYTPTPEGRQLLDAAQTLRCTLAGYARDEQQGVLSMSAAQPGIADMVSAMRKSGFDILYVDDLLDEFGEISDRGCRAFELHFFAGLAPERIAGLLQIPERTATRDIAVAKAWLLERLKEKVVPDIRQLHYSLNAGKNQIQRRSSWRIRSVRISLNGFGYSLRATYRSRSTPVSRTCFSESKKATWASAAGVAQALN